MPMPRPCVNGHNESLATVNDSVDSSVGTFSHSKILEGSNIKKSSCVSFTLTASR